MSSWDEVIEDEDTHDGHLLFDWPFSQTRAINCNLIIVSHKKEIRRVITNQSLHIYNQNKLNERIKARKVWDVLLYNQSTCDAIINRKLLSNIRKFRWNLRFKTLVGD